MSTETEPTTARLSMKERQWQLREDAILDAAIELIQKKGLSAMTLEDITEAIGISRPTLYLHFRSKEDIFVNVALRGLRMAQETLKSQDPSKPVSDQIKAFTSTCVFKRFSEQEMQLYEVKKMVMSQGNLDPRLKSAEQEFMRDLANLLKEGQDTGQVRSDIPAVLLAEMMTSAFKNQGLDGLVADGVVTSDQITDALIKLVSV